MVLARIKVVTLNHNSTVTAISIKIFHMLFDPIQGGVLKILIK